MLTKLSVQNYALIRELDVDFEKGLTIITGETGAGKSILLGALSLILGTRADTSVLLDKNEKCIIEGSFMVDDYDLNGFFDENSLDYEKVTTVRREINPAGKSRAFINDTPVNLNILKELGEKLIDIHSQHQTLMLNDNSFQLKFVDSFAGTSEKISHYRKLWLEYLRLKKEFAEEREKVEKNRADLEYYQYQLNQLDAMNLKPGEQEELEAEQEMLAHSEEIKVSLVNAMNLFSGEGISILQMLREVKLNLLKIKGYLPSAEVLGSRTESALIELDDIAAEVDKLCNNIDADPERLTAVNQRLDMMYSLIQKHRSGNLNELIVRREEIRGFVKSVVSGDERLALMEKALTDSRAIIQKIAEEISADRNEVIPEIELRVTDLLKQLGMPDARFRVSMSRSEDFTSTGIDQVDFLFSANRQIAPENLSRVASGGELSRVMLSLKSLLARSNNLPTIIFDEIDSGVSGEVADKVGQILSGMGKHMQVINITHLPQVASRGTKHYHVYKANIDDATFTRVKLLNRDERILELARLLSGSEVTEAAMRNARELLKSSSN